MINTGRPPSVRRVSAWVGDDDEPPRLDRDEAYADAVDVLLHQAFERRQPWSGMGEGDFFDLFPPQRRYGIAKALRREDERMGAESLDVESARLRSEVERLNARWLDLRSEAGAREQSARALFDGDSRARGLAAVASVMDALTRHEREVSATAPDPTHAPEVRPGGDASRVRFVAREQFKLDSPSWVVADTWFQVDDQPRTVSEHGTRDAARKAAKDLNRDAAEEAIEKAGHR